VIDWVDQYEMVKPHRFHRSARKTNILGYGGMAEYKMYSHLSCFEASLLLRSWGSV
jgi:hypothetical protein